MQHNTLLHVSPQIFFFSTKETLRKHITKHEYFCSLILMVTKEQNTYGIVLCEPFLMYLLFCDSTISFNVEKIVLVGVITITMNGKRFYYYHLLVVDVINVTYAY